MCPCPMGINTYTVQQGETLWQLAAKFNTSIDAILSINPGVYPANIIVGTVIYIPNGVNKVNNKMNLINNMRILWEEHITWTRLTIVSMVFNLPDQALVTNRLLRNATDMAAALEPFYGKEKASRFGNLISEHLVIASQLVKAAIAGDNAAAADAERRWYANADEIAFFLSSINPKWSRLEWMEMLHEHLALTKAEAVSFLTKDYAKGISLFDEIEKQALKMADVMATGIIKQFPNEFIC